MRKLFSLGLLLLALNVEAAANKLVSTLPTTNVIWMTNYVMVVLQAGLSNQTFLVPWTNIAQQISAAQVWTNASGVVIQTTNAPLQITNSLDVAGLTTLYGHLNVISQMTVIDPAGADNTIDTYAYRNSGSFYTVLALTPGNGTDGGYGNGVLLDPGGDNGGPPFLFSTTYSNTIAASSSLFSIQNSHTNKFSVTGAGTIVIAGTTNQIIFGATNDPPVSAIAPTRWISVQVTGESGVYRLPLYE